MPDLQVLQHQEAVSVLLVVVKDVHHSLSIRQLLQEGSLIVDLQGDTNVTITFMYTGYTTLPHRMVYTLARR